PLAVGEAVVRGAKLPVFSAAPPSLREFFGFFAASHGDKEFLVYGDERLSFAAVYARSLKMAAMLQHRYGIAKGDRVAIAMRNYPEWVMAFIGITHLGAIAVPMNAWWTGEELDYGLSDSGTRLVFADEERARRISSTDFTGTVLTVRTSSDVAASSPPAMLSTALAMASIRR
ncbi:MAG: acyl--CoA ligase, partial [Congregibacter sp.]|nr:acyl--CoA ligase [Congregibacter sp.]